MFSTDFIFRQQENLVDNKKCQAGFRPLCNKIPCHHAIFSFQTVISESRINFECNLKKSKQSLNSRIEFLQAKLTEIEAVGQESLDQLAQSRRYDFEQINLAITKDIR